MFYTYAHYTPEGTLFYIGKGSRGRYKTMLKRNEQWNAIVKKHGKPKAVVLANWETEQEALDHEKILISCFKDMGFQLCNLCDGGKGNSGYKLSELAKSKIKKSLFGNKRSLGYAQNVLHRTKNRKALEGNKYSLGFTHTQAYKEKISNLLIGNKNATKNQYKWIGINEITGDEVIFFNTTSLIKAGFQHANIIKCLKGERKSHKGYTWRRELWEGK